MSWLSRLSHCIGCLFQQQAPVPFPFPFSDKAHNMNRIHPDYEATYASFTRLDAACDGDMPAQRELSKLRKENERLEQQCKESFEKRGELYRENERLREALQKVLDDSEIGVVPRSHLDRIERLLRGEG